MLIWCDLETTGLDCRKDVVLELGLKITDDNLDTVPVLGGTYSAIVLHDTFTCDYEGWATVVREMHAHSGLLQALSTGKLWQQIVDEAIDFVQLATNGEKIPLAGSTVGFDRGFLRQYAPALEGLFHYRSVDVSSVKELVRRWYPDLPAPRSEKKHRVLSDIEDSIHELRYYRDHAFR